jgi:IS1 family transposase
MLGTRDGGTATEFMQDVAGQLSHRIQLSTDGHTMNLEAVEDAFGASIDYAMIQKIYGTAPETETRYSPAVCTGVKRYRVQGNPDPRHVSTSYVERANLTMRMGMRRFTRLTNAFSKKLTNHAAMIALFFMHYNFCRIHQTLRVTPAMKAGVSDHVWEIGDILALLDSN